MTVENHSTRSTEHKEGKATVRITYYKHKTLADGSHPFMICITKNRIRKYISTGVSLHPTFWNFDKNTFRKSLPQQDQEEIKQETQKWLDRYKLAAKELAQSDEEHAVNTIIERVAVNRKNSRQFRLIGYFGHLIDQLESTNKLGNRKVYKDVQNNLKHFLGSVEDVPFSSVNVRFCNEWENYMRSNGLTEVTMSLKFRTLRTVFNKAIANGYAKVEHYPFSRNASEKYKFQVGKFSLDTKKRAIHKSELNKIQSFIPKKHTGKYATLRDKSSRLLLARNIFLFSYYCGGINFIDIATLKWSNIETDFYGNKRLKYVRKKTGKDFNIKLLEVPLDLLEIYSRSDFYEQDSYIFPILNKHIHKSSMQIHNRINKVMTQVNTDLKLIAADTGVGAKLTTYVARHSFATSLRLAGEEIAVISEAMGHSDEATTRIYLTELGTELIDSAYENL